MTDVADQVTSPSEAETFSRTMHERASRVEARELVRSLVADLGAALTARLAGADDETLVCAWGEGRRSFEAAHEHRLRAAYEVVQTLRGWEATDTIRAWFVGANPELRDMAPARVLATDPQSVLDAAYSFIAG